MEKNFKAAEQLVEFIAKNLSREVVDLKKVDFGTTGYNYSTNGFRWCTYINEFDFDNLQTNPTLKINLKYLNEKVDGLVVILVQTLNVSCAEEISKAMLLFVSKKEIEKYITDNDYVRGFVSVPLRELNFKKVDYRVINFNPSKVEIPLSKMIEEDRYSKVKYTSQSLRLIQENAEVFNINNLRVITIHNIAPKDKEYEKLMVVMENKNHLCYRDGNLENYNKALQATGQKESDGIFSLDFDF